MTAIVEVPLMPVNWSGLNAELQAVSPAYEGMSKGKAWPGVLRLHFADNTPQATVDAALAVYAAHNPALLTPAQQLAARRVAAMGDVNNADFLALYNAIEAASSLAAVKPLMKALLLLQYRVALAAGLTDADEPGA